MKDSNRQAMRLGGELRALELSGKGDAAEQQHDFLAEHRRVTDRLQEARACPLPLALGSYVQDQLSRTGGNAVDSILQLHNMDPARERDPKEALRRMMEALQVRVDAGRLSPITKNINTESTDDSAAGAFTKPLGREALCRHRGIMCAPPGVQDMTFQERSETG